MITHDIDLCIGLAKQENSLTVKSCDTGINIRVALFVCRHGAFMDKHEAYTIPQGCTPVLRISKPDKTYCIQEGTVQSNRLIFAPKPQAFTAAGTAQAEVSLFAEDGRRVTSATFDIIIPPECVCDCGTESGSYVDVMSEQIRAAIEAADRAEEAAKRAEEATDADNLAQAVSEYLTENPPAPGPAGPAGPTGEKGDKGEKGEPGAIKFYVVWELPATGEPDAIYLLGDKEAIDANNAYDEYIYMYGNWERVGSTKVSADLANYVTFQDYAKEGKAGVVKPGTGLSVTNAGAMQIEGATKGAIEKKLGARTPLVPQFIDDIVKTGITTNQIPLTDEEKQAAKAWLGVTENGGGSVEIPEALPNPHKLTFTGAVNAEYDGSEAVEVEIPAGGGAEWELLESYELPEGSEEVAGGVEIVFPEGYNEYLLIAELQATAESANIIVYPRVLGQLPDGTTVGVDWGFWDYYPGAASCRLSLLFERKEAGGIKHFRMSGSYANNKPFGKPSDSYKDSGWLHHYGVRELVKWTGVKLSRQISALSNYVLLGRK